MKVKKPGFRIDEIILIAIVVIVAIAVGFYDKTQKVEYVEAEKIINVVLDGGDLGFANNGTIDEAKIKEIEGMDYKELKQKLNAKRDFCVYVEDEKGNIVLAKGSPKLNSNGLSCS